MILLVPRVTILWWPCLPTTEPLNYTLLEKRRNELLYTSYLGPSVPIDALIFLRPTCFSIITQGLKKDMKRFEWQMKTVIHNIYTILSPRLADA